MPRPWIARKWKRIAIGLGIGLLLCGVYTWFFGFNTMMILEMRSIAMESPIVRQIPRPLPDLSVSSAPGTKLSYFGYEFEVPWDDIDAKSINVKRTRLVVYSRGGNGLVFSSAQPKEFINIILDKDGGLDKSNFQQIYGNAPLQSDYAMHCLILNATPDNVTLFSSRKDVVGTSMLVVIKSIMSQSELFSIQNKDFKGFQWGDPKHLPLHVNADLFSDEGGMEFIFLRRKDATSPALTQPEINRVLQTVRKTPDPHVN
ncbi:MAG TPA: hypothetical protein VN176_07065 [Verrucomicrobiae bacterium]|jgi:hypothetical protein|nr:hypothetical protein [Verrucomicrobiae bacterium]